MNLGLILVVVMMTVGIILMIIDAWVLKALEVSRKNRDTFERIARNLEGLRADVRPLSDGMRDVANAFSPNHCVYSTLGAEETERRNAMRQVVRKAFGLPPDDFGMPQ